MQPEPDYESIVASYIDGYDSANYERGLTAHVMRRGHELLDRTGPQNSDLDVVEVGSGSGTHLQSVVRSFSRYVMTDSNEQMLEIARQKHSGRKNIEFKIEDAGSLSFPDDSFDQLIATHVLEHMQNPHLVLREWNRVVRKGGCISIILPCDPGLLWRLGRMFGPRKSAEQRNLPYDYFQAREHVNSIFNLRTFVDYYFDEVNEIWWPFRVPAPDVNLLYIAHIPVR